MNEALHVTRVPVDVEPDPRRVIARPFMPGGPGRIADILDRVAAIPKSEVASLLQGLLADYRVRHRDIRGVFRQHYQAALATQKGRAELGEDRRLLAGAYFTNEYSLESVALFNPSMVA